MTNYGVKEAASEAASIVNSPLMLGELPSVFHSSVPHRSVMSAEKRWVDIVGAIAGILLLAILFLPIAIAIRVESPGSVLYKQKRYGLQGRPFTLLKFRSMVKDADHLKTLVQNESEGLIFKNEQDPRITRVGKLLRRTSLDEVPQFWNVLVGDMSLVGTRPPTHDEVIHYSDRHWQRLNVKPGLTGLWQVSGRSEIKNFEEIVSLDLQYQALWTLSYDLQIILKTFGVLLSKSGAC
ncbi:MAG: sugar transferase [Leptolyngbyaceae cyanobacterium CSU_1_4]|nr:sugar transferase [Leptolyngbyaceae cyanobacterium CSU_1_4]